MINPLLVYRCHYSCTCIRWHCIKCSPCIKWLVVKITNFSLSYCKFPLHFKWSWSPLLSTNSPFVCLPLVEQSLKGRTTQIKLRIIFQVKLNPYLSLEINVSSIFEAAFLHQVVKNAIKLCFW